MVFRLLLVAFSCTQFCVGQQVIPLSDEDKRSFVDTHNSLRKGEGATDMQIIQWNDELQKFAEKVAARCIQQHSSDNERSNLAGFSHVGENLAFGQMTPKVAVEEWYKEKKDYTFETGECAKEKQCGHYTQVVWASTTAIGCGMADCPQTKFKKWIACNYGPGGNMRTAAGVIQPPHTRGATQYSMNTHLALVWVFVTCWYFMCQ